MDLPSKQSAPRVPQANQSNAVSLPDLKRHPVSVPAANRSQAVALTDLKQQGAPHVPAANQSPKG